ncbi:hypothetical protein CSKR_105652 [Clonorchis sinensis]|uniref:Uncharacterized protein n=1 Tax=Clonorchis sinensis TaxID=79923 RepID=A0A3R7F746_CLOSI|nr:hypothetical protein CSKR_105652 [Clonorchis sinensis]
MGRRGTQTATPRQVTSRQVKVRRGQIESNRGLEAFNKYIHLQLSLLFPSDSPEFQQNLSFMIFFNCNCCTKYICTKQTNHKVAKTSSIANRRFCPSWFSSDSCVNFMLFLNPNRTKFDKYTHLQINLFFTVGSAESHLNLSSMKAFSETLRDTQDTQITPKSGVKSNQFGSDGRLTWNPAESLAYDSAWFQHNVRLTETRELCLPDGHQEGLNRSSAAGTFAATL